MNRQEEIARELKKSFWAGFCFGIFCVVIIAILNLGIAGALAQESYDYNDGVSLHTETYPVGQTVNAEFGYTIVYWIVEYSGQDAEGNWHRWREEVSAEPQHGKLTVAQKAADQLVEKLKAGDEQAHGFMRAVQGGQDEELSTVLRP